MTTAVVPLRDGAGKTRLADQFGARQRGDLVGLLAHHVVSTLLAAGPVRDVVVVTRDLRFATEVLPTDQRVAVVSQPETEPGLNGAVSFGRRLGIAGGADRVLVIHTDLPLLTGADVRALLDHRVPVVMAPDLPGQGTNALMLDASAEGFTFRFGPGSRAAHATQAHELGLPTTVVHRPGTATDLDTPADWARLPAEAHARLTTDRGAPPPPGACADA